MVKTFAGLLQSWSAVTGRDGDSQQGSARENAGGVGFQGCKEAEEWDEVRMGVSSRRPWKIHLRRRVDASQQGPNATKKLGAHCTCTNTSRGHSGASRLLGRKCLLGKGRPIASTFSHQHCWPTLLQLETSQKHPCSFYWERVSLYSSYQGHAKGLPPIDNTEHVLES